MREIVMKVKMLIILAGFIGTSALFANQNDWVNQLREAQQKQTQESHGQDVLMAKAQTQLEIQKQMPFINKLLSVKKSTIEKKRGGKPADGAIVFVSFSMPDSLLVSISEQADAYNIPVVLNGLVENDFKKTLNKLVALKKYAKERHQEFHGVSIDPVWFEQFGINAVPALVVTKRPAHCAFQKQCADQPFDVVYGNASIKDGLNIIADQGEQVPDVARKILGENTDA